MRLAKGLRRTALLLFGSTAALLVLEIALRLRFPAGGMDVYRATSAPIEASRWVDHPFFPFVGRPNAEYTLDVPVNGATVTVDVRNNSFGFRSHEFPRSKGAEDFFIVALGESTTWGAAAETNSVTWPELLEARLRARYPDRNVSVFNLGTQNITLPYSVVALALYATVLKPDLVVTYHGYNEFSAATARGYRVDHSHFFRDLALGMRFTGLQRTIPQRALSSYAVTYLTSLIDNEVLGANNLAYYVQHSTRMADRGEDGIRSALTRDWQQLRTIEALAREYGGRALFATFQFFDGEYGDNRLVNETLRAFLDENHLRYVDQDALVPDYDRSLQYDACHFTRAGDEAMAENFFRRIVADGDLERR